MCACTACLVCPRLHEKQLGRIYCPALGLKVSDESSITQAFEEYGTVVSCEVGGHPEAIVSFSTHEDALTARDAASQLVHICGGIDTLYNERSYDGRRGEAGRADDDGRGW